MEVVEGLCSILACDLTQNDLSTRVGVYKIGHIVDFVIDNNPEIVLGSVLK